MASIVCFECNGSGALRRIEPDCCGKIHVLGYCRADCAVPREVLEPCDMCGGSGEIHSIEPPSSPSGEGAGDGQRSPIPSTAEERAHEKRSSGHINGRPGRSGVPAHAEGVAG